MPRSTEAGDPQTFVGLAGVATAVGGAHPWVFCVVDGLVEQLGDELVVEGVGDAAPEALSVNQAEMAQHP